MFLKYYVTLIPNLQVEFFYRALIFHNFANTDITSETRNSVKNLNIPSAIRPIELPVPTQPTSWTLDSEEDGDADLCGEDYLYLRKTRFSSQCI